jgi:hypothetical protein
VLEKSSRALVAQSFPNEGEAGLFVLMPRRRTRAEDEQRSQSTPKACGIVGKGYQWVYSRFLSGELQDRQVDGRFWLVDRESAVRLKSESRRVDTSR